MSDWAGTGNQWDTAGYPPGGGPPNGEPQYSGKPNRKDRKARKDPKTRKLSLAKRAKLLAALALLGTGVLIGWWSVSGLSVLRSSSESAETQTFDYSGLDDGVMPDVRGLTLDDARQAIADAGVDIEDIEVEAEPWAGRPDMVVSQSPAHGVTGPESVALSVSEPAKVPEVAGVAILDVTEQLGGLGTSVDLRYRYEPGAPAGTALRTEPAAGEPLPDEVVVVVADAGFSTYVSALSRECSSADASLDGRDYPNSVSCRADDDPGSYVWITKRSVDELVADVGIDDSDEPGTTVEVEVFADGRPVARVEAGYGRVERLEANVRGALRVEIVTRAVALPSNSSSASVVLGDARFIGETEAMKALDE